MKVVFYTNNISPHQLPLAREVMRRVGRENFLYVGEEIAWRGRTIDAGEVRTLVRGAPEASEWLENADVMYTGGSRPISASAAMLPRERLYHAGDWRALARLIEGELRGELPPCSIGDWTAVAGADRLLGLIMSGIIRYE